MPESDGGGWCAFDDDSMFVKMRRKQEQHVKELDDIMQTLQQGHQSDLDENCSALVNALKPKDEMVLNRDYILSHNAHIKEKRHFMLEDGSEKFTLITDGGSGMDVPREVFDRVTAGDNLIGVYLLP